MKVEIEIPDGHEIDQITFKPIVKPLPKTWEELETVKGFYIDEYRDVEAYLGNPPSLHNKNIFATKEQAEASIALAQLSQLIRVYNNGWEPDWGDKTEKKHAIYFHFDLLQIATIYNSRNFLTFKTTKLAEHFLINFKELILIAKPLL